MTARFKVVGVDDSRDYCECCGKTGLKRVVWIEDGQTGEVKHFGTTCAVSSVKGFGVDCEVVAAIRREDDRVKALSYVTRHEYRRLGGKYEKKGEFSSRPTDLALYARARQAVISRMGSAA